MSVKLNKVRSTKMKFAVIGDIHSNKYALESVLTHIKEQGVDTILSTGDLVGYLPYPNEVISLLKKHHVFVVKGNHDDTIANASSVSAEELKRYDVKQIQSKASNLYTNYVLSDENRTYLKNLPHELNFKILDKTIQVVHGSHRDIAEYLNEDEELLTQLAPTVLADVLICGHTHMPYHLNVGGIDFINVGSVGKPKTGDDLATYTIVEVKENEVISQLMKVSYNVDQLVKDIEENEMISNDLIEMIRKGY
ncbi:MAG TPA: YfcE family phosphodiesterase [Firmicutes bacterium]|nr:YfcE family phosphodiesterase [Bacillota bacterium]